ncbi:hypothetical protein KP509_02G053700 [Ceratopteris richardii]|uniref:Uncharacterized protein n=1 Tax=Ceratopteris richardii TaxID=49495 RepID=A0A8T2V5V2_CERRI|nr:hypothetical protein KP509_02G053700 [Ceratopteris richardii]
MNLCQQTRSKATLKLFFGTGVMLMRKYTIFGMTNTTQVMTMKTIFAIIVLMSVAASEANEQESYSRVASPRDGSHQGPTAAFPSKVRIADPCRPQSRRELNPPRHVTGEDSSSLPGAVRRIQYAMKVFHVDYNEPKTHPPKNN